MVLPSKDSALMSLGLYIAHDFIDKQPQPIQLPKSLLKRFKLANTTRELMRLVAASEKTRRQLDVIVAEMQNANDMVAQIAAASEQQAL